MADPQRHPGGQGRAFFIGEDEGFGEPQVGRELFIDLLEDLLFVEGHAHGARELLEGVQACEPAVQLFLGPVQLQVGLDDELGLFIQFIE